MSLQSVGFKGVTSRAEFIDSTADILIDEDRLDRAADLYQEELAIYSELGQQESVAAVRVELAAVAIEQGHASEAEPQARNALALAQKDNAPWNNSNAEIVLTRSLLAQNRLTEAHSEAKNATATCKNRR